MLSAFAATNDDLLLDDAAALREAIDNGNDYAVTLDHIAKKKQQAIKQTGGFSAAMRGLGNIAKSVGASLLTGLATAAIGAGISAVIDLIDKQVNAAKYAKEALQEVSAEWDELAEKQKSAGELVSKYEADYERLSKGVNMVTGENLALSDDEYELFKQINAELADSALASVQGITLAYDEQGNAIVRLSDQMDNLSEAYGQLEKQTRADIIKGFEDAYPQARIALGSNAMSTGSVEGEQILQEIWNRVQSAETEDEKVSAVSAYLHELQADAGVRSGILMAEIADMWGLETWSESLASSDQWVANMFAG